MLFNTNLYNLEIAIPTDQILLNINFEECKKVIRFMPEYGSAFVNAGWITAFEYKHQSYQRRFQNESVFHVFQWLDLHEVHIVPADSFSMESTYYNPC